MWRSLSGGLFFLGLTAWLFLEPNRSEADKSTPRLRTQLRRPVSLVVLGENLLVGNQQSGSITVIERSTGKVIVEHEIARSIADMVLLPNSQSLLVQDDERKQLLKVSFGNGPPVVKLLAELPFAGFKLAVDEKANRIFLDREMGASGDGIDDG